MAEQRVRLEIGSHGERPAATVLQFLEAITDSHDGLLAFFNLLDRGSGVGVDPRRAVERLQPRSPRRSRNDGDALSLGYERGIRSPRNYGRSPDLTRRPPRQLMQELAPADQRLEVLRIAIASPGIWEFVGALNPLTFINDFLDRQHERKKDVTYRNDAERVRLNQENRRRDIENELLEVQLVRERLQLAQSLGIDRDEQRLLLNRFAVRPLLELDATVERDMAFPASALAEVIDAEVERPANDLPPRIE